MNPVFLTPSTVAPMSSEAADVLFRATGLSHLCENVERYEADDSNFGQWVYELEDGNSVIVTDDGTVGLYDGDGCGRLYDMSRLLAT